MSNMRGQAFLSSPQLNSSDRKNSGSKQNGSVVSPLGAGGNGLWSQFNSSSMLMNSSCGADGANQFAIEAAVGSVDPVEELKTVLKTTNLADLRDIDVHEWLESTSEWVARGTLPRNSGSNGGAVSVFANPTLIEIDVEVRLLVCSVLSTLPWHRYTDKSVSKTAKGKSARVIRAFERLCTVLVSNEASLKAMISIYQAEQDAAGSAAAPNPHHQATTGASANLVVTHVIEALFAPFVEAAVHVGTHTEVHIPTDTIKRVISAAAKDNLPAVSGALHQVIAGQFPKDYVDVPSLHARFLSVLMGLALDDTFPELDITLRPQQSGGIGGGIHAGSAKKPNRKEEASQAEAANKKQPAQVEGDEAPTVQNHVLQLRKDILKVVLQKLVAMENSLGDGDFWHSPDARRGCEDRIRDAVTCVYRYLLADLQHTEVAGQATQAIWWFKDLLVFHVDKVLLLKDPVAVQYLAPSLVGKVTTSTLEITELIHKCLSVVVKGRPEARPSVGIAAGGLLGMSGTRLSAGSFVAAGGGGRMSGSMSRSSGSLGQLSTRPYTAQERTIAAEHLFPLFAFLQNILPEELSEGTVRRVFKWVAHEVANLPPPLPMTPAASPVSINPLAPGTGFPLAPPSMSGRASVLSSPGSLVMPVAPPQNQSNIIVETMLAQGMAICKLLNTEVDAARDIPPDLLHSLMVRLGDIPITPTTINPNAATATMRGSFIFPTLPSPALGSTGMPPISPTPGMPSLPPSDDQHSLSADEEAEKKRKNREMVDKVMGAMVREGKLRPQMYSSCPWEVPHPIDHAQLDELHRQGSFEVQGAATTGTTSGGKTSATVSTSWLDNIVTSRKPVGVSTPAPSTNAAVGASSVQPAVVMSKKRPADPTPAVDTSASKLADKRKKMEGGSEEKKYKQSPAVPALRAPPPAKQPTPIKMRSNSSVSSSSASDDGSSSSSGGDDEDSGSSVSVSSSSSDGSDCSRESTASELFTDNGTDGGRHIRGDSEERHRNRAILDEECSSIDRSSLGSSTSSGSGMDSDSSTSHDDDSSDDSSNDSDSSDSDSSSDVPSMSPLQIDEAVTLITGMHHASMASHLLNSSSSSSEYNTSSDDDITISSAGYH